MDALLFKTLLRNKKRNYNFKRLNKFVVAVCFFLYKVNECDCSLLSMCQHARVSISGQIVFPKVQWHRFRSIPFLIYIHRFDTILLSNRSLVSLEVIDCLFSPMYFRESTLPWLYFFLSSTILIGFFNWSRMCINKCGLCVKRWAGGLY